MFIPLYLPRLKDSTSDNITILAADIGGTKTSLGLFKAHNQQLIALAEATYVSKAYSDFADIVLRFIEEYNLSTPTCLSIGVAGPVLGDQVQLTNLPWTLDRRLLTEDTGIKDVCMINDLEATAYGLAGLNEEYLAHIYAGKPGHSGNIAILAPGTGLGEAALYWDGSAYHPFATEGGHSGFSPRTDLDVELYQYLRQSHEIVSWEHVISGNGIYSIYKFLRDGKGHKEPAWLTEKFKTDDPAAVISHTAMRDLDNTCIQAMSLFVRYMACESSSLVLKLKATGGLYLGGGIPPKIYPLLRNKTFREHFIKSDRMEDLLEEVPVQLILNSKTALIGAAYFGAFGPEMQ